MQPANVTDWGSVCTKYLGKKLGTVCGYFFARVNAAARRVHADTLAHGPTVSADETQACAGDMAARQDSSLG
jgi:hypothetical protein